MLNYLKITNMAKDKQKQLLIEVMNADAKDGLYKQQSAVEWLVNEIESKAGAWENISIRRVQISIDVSDYLELKRQAMQMEKEQMIKAYEDNHALGHIYGNNGELYYKETYQK